MRRSTWLMPATLVALAGGLLVTPTAAGGEVGFVEDFALAKDRTAALKQLIPGTEDYYYYHCLHYLNTGDFARIEPLTVAWHRRHNQTPRLTEIQTRLALLTFDKDPKKTLEFLRNKLGLHFDHQKEVLGVAPNLPTALDPKLIARDTLKASSMQRWGNLDNFEDLALDYMAAENLNWHQRRHLLSRLQRPDVPNLPKLVAEDLVAKDQPTSFGAYPVHRMMTIAQLEELVKLRPEVLNQNNFVVAYATKLQPGADDDWKRDRGLTKAYLERLQTFADRLAPVHNPFKAHVRFHRLAFDRAENVYDRARFVEYLKLPRQMPYMAAAWTNREECRRWPATLGADFSAATLLPPVGNDEPLVRSILAHFFEADPDAKDFAPYVDDTYLRFLAAETQIVNGKGDPDRWSALLPPELLQQIKDRVDIEFAHTNPTEFGVDDPVEIELTVKNVPSLLVKVYEINARHFYRTGQREVDTDINLDGLVPNAQRVIPGNPDPFRRVTLNLTFPDPQAKVAVPEANRPGIYVIDFIGGGKSSRALVRKGRLHPVVTTTTAGQLVRVVDEKRRPVNDAAVWLGGAEYTADKDGAILVPFSTGPGRRPVVLSRGDFASLDFIDHKPEAYQLTAGIHVDRESLLSQRIAPVLVRPGLTLNGQPVSVKLLEDVRLRITSVDTDGVPSSTEVPDFKLFQDRESVHEIRVPPRLATLAVTLTAQVKALSTGQTVNLAATQTFAVNGIAKTDKIEDLHLAKFGNDYVLEVLGRTGEAKQDRPIQFAIKHREFKEQVPVSLKTDAAGRVFLGPLTDIVSFTATNPDGVGHTWNLSTDRHTYRQLVHAKAGEAITLPYLGTAGKPDRSELALFEVHGSEIRADKFDAIAVNKAMIELKGLAAGDYDLLLKQTGEKIRVRVAAGEAQSGHVFNAVRQLELAGLKPVQIESVTVEKDDLVVRLRDATKFTRVHVFATRYQPAFPAFGNLSRVRDAELEGATPTHADSVFLTGRNIGDEYRYVLERRNQKKFPGNMLERPTFLLNPWAVRTTETGEQLAAAGEAFGRRGGVTAGQTLARGVEAAKEAKGHGWAGPAVGDFTDLDFLYDAAAVAVNKLPDADGVLRFPRKEFGPHALLHVVAVDPLNTTVRSTALPEVKAQFADLRLRDGLDPTRHFTQQKQVTIAEQGKPFVIEDAAGSRFEVYDSLARVYALYATMSKDPKLAEFAFVLKWPTLKPEEKRELYSKHACHELNFFLSKKDPEFFNTVVKPYAANKKDKTFLDHYLLGGDVAKYSNPWEFGRLNVPERVFLARRQTGELPKTARHISDMLRLIPVNTEQQLFHFSVAVDNGALDAPDVAKFAKPGDRDRPVVLAAPAMDSIGAPDGAPAQPKAGVMFGQAPGGFPTGGAAAAPGGPGAGGGGMPGMPARPGSLAAGRDGRTNTFREKSGAKKDDGAAEGGEGDRDQAQEKVQEEKLRALNENEALFFDDARGKLGLARQLYRKLDPTMEWAENNYYKLPISQQVAGLVPVSDFWADYARYDGAGPFLTRHIPEAARNFTEMMFALACLDLPFESPKHDTKYEAGKMTLTPGGRVIAFHEEVKPAGGKGGSIPILVSQNFYRHGDRFREENGEKYDKFVTDEFVTHVVYGCQCVVTNPTSSRQRLSVLIQMPVGSIPLAGARMTKSYNLDLEPYRTQTIDYLFYFPRPGNFGHFPVHVAKNEEFVTAPTPFAFTVVAKPTKLDTGSWDHVSQNGSDADVLAFLNRENVRALNLDKIAFRLRDRGFFEAVTGLLRERHLYHPTTYSYGVFHADLPTARQFLLHADALVGECGGPIESPLLAVDPVARHQYEHLEYKPLVNARAHSLGNRRQIVNDAFHAQYHKVLKVLTYRNALTDDDLLAVTYYLLLQDRIEEALETFARVKRDKVGTEMQYDYCAAYLALFKEEPKTARAIATAYLRHPVDRWRNAFTTVIAQVDEIEGKGGKVIDKDDRDQNQGGLAATEPGFEVAVDGAAVNLTWQNIDAVKVNYYLMDVELLFSTNPFVTRSAGQFASIRPNATANVQLPPGRNKFALPIPAEFEGKNVLVEVTAAGKTRAVPHFATTMVVNMSENMGQLRLADAAGQKGLGKVYVKVYAKLADGSVKFHKDGYTDLRGRFDYVSVNTPERQAIERFSILMLSDDRGAMIREVTPPQR